MARDGMLRRVQRSKNQQFAPSPVTAQIAEAVRTVANVETLNRLRRTKGDDWMEAMMKPILQKVAGQLNQQLDQTGKLPAQDETSALINKMIQLQAVKAMGGHAEGGESQLNQTLQVMKTAAEAHKEVAQIERQRREEAETDVGGQIDAALTREQQRNDFMMSLIKETKDQELKREKELADLRVALVETRQSQEVSAINEKLDRVLNAKDQEILSIRAEAEKERIRLEAEHKTQLAMKDKDYEIADLRKQSALPLSADPQYLHQVNWVQHSARTMEQEERHKEESHKSWLKTQETLRDELPNVIQTVRDIVGGGISADNPLAQAPTPDGPGLGGDA